MYNFDLRPLIWVGIFSGLLIAGSIWGSLKLVDCVFLKHQKGVIESKTLIVPEIKLVVEDNVVDTIYVYKQPKI